MDIRKKFFTEMGTRYWNGLPRESPSLDVLKERLNMDLVPLAS